MLGSVWGTLIPAFVVALIVAAVIMSMIKDNKSGKSIQCGGDCKHCGGHCHTEGK